MRILLKLASMSHFACFILYLAHALLIAQWCHRSAVARLVSSTPAVVFRAASLCRTAAYDGVCAHPSSSLRNAISVSANVVCLSVSCIVDLIGLVDRERGGLAASGAIPALTAVLHSSYAHLVLQTSCFLFGCYICGGCFIFNRRFFYTVLFLVFGF